LPAVALPGRQPGDRAERTGDPRPDHGRLRADGEHVRGDPRQRSQLSDPPRNAQQPGQAQHTSRDEDHVLAADRQQVVEARHAEVRAEAGRQVLVLAEDDSGHDVVAQPGEFVPAQGLKTGQPPDPACLISDGDGVLLRHQNMNCEL